MAEPEADAKADPAGYYGYYGLGSGYHGHRLGYYGYPVITNLDNKWGHNLGKRDAEADPAYGYYGHGTYRGFPYARWDTIFFNEKVLGQHLCTGLCYQACM